MSDKPKKLKWHVIAKCGSKEIEFYAKTTDEVITMLMAWFRHNFEPKEWPSILKWIEGIKK